MPAKNFNEIYIEYSGDEYFSNDQIIPVIIESPSHQYKLSKHFLNNSQIDQINEYIGKNFSNDNIDKNISSPTLGMAIISLIFTILINSIFLYINKSIPTEKTYNIILKTN